MLRSTFAGFSMAQLALSASQRALDLTGQNISNINTAGYTRQRLDLASISPTGASYSNVQGDCRVGQGVTMTGITQVRDQFLDIQYRSHLAQVGTVDAQDSALREIGTIFDETDKSAISNALSSVVSQLNNLAKPENANQGAADTLVRSSMEVLLNAIRQNSTDLGRVESDLITKLQGTDINKINGYLNSISEFNRSIKNSQILGNPALELMDDRNRILDDLATYLPIDVTYSDLDVGGGIIVDAMKITFRDTDGTAHVLLDDNKIGKFEFETNGGKAPVKVTVTGVDDGDPDTPPPVPKDVTGALGDGVLKGSLDALNKSGTFDDPESDFRGIGYYQKFFDRFVDQFATTLNELNKDKDGNDQNLFEKIDPTQPFGADNIKISDAWMNGTVRITTTKEAVDPNVDNKTAYDNVLKIIDAISSKKMDFTTADGVGGKKLINGTFFEAYTSLQSTQSIDRQASSTVLKSRMSVLDSIADSKDSVSGVYLDEEVMNLMRYQQSYNAAARLMTTLDEALDTLINKTGVIGR